jgi:MoaA/NifB/PqqE/SkfB family radical SAM enzyme
MLHLWNYINRGRLWSVYARSVLKYGTPRKMLNALRTEWAYRRKKINVRTHPYVLFIEPLYYCNLHCPLCPRELEPLARQGREQAGRLPLDLIDDIFKELGPDLFQCHIFGNGEPMLDWPRTRYVVEAAHRAKVFTLISTNCTTITPQIADELVTCGLDYLVCAIDGTSQASYEKYRVGGRFDQAFEGMRLICAAARKHRSRISLEWQFLVNAFTYSEIDRAKDLARELGMYLRLSPLGGVSGYPDRQEYWNAPDPAWTVQHDGAFDHDFHCYWLWRALVINSNGQLGRCPGFSNVAELGSIVPSVTHRSVRDEVMSLYNGPVSQRARQLFLKAQSSDSGQSYPDPCASCTCFARHHGASLTRSTPPRNSALKVLSNA